MPDPFNDSLTQETAIKIRTYAMEMIRMMQTLLGEVKPELNDLVVVIGVGMRESGCVEVAMKQHCNAHDLEALDALQAGFKLSLDHITKDVKARIAAVNN